jgi:hypothetical protein
VGAGFVDGAAVDGAAVDGAAEEDCAPPPPQALSSASKQNKKPIRMYLSFLNLAIELILRAGRQIPSQYFTESDRRYYSPCELASVEQFPDSSSNRLGFSASS